MRLLLAVLADAGGWRGGYNGYNLREVAQAKERIAEACQVGKTLVLMVRGESQVVAKTTPTVL